MRTIAAGALAALSLTAVAASPAGAAAGPAAAARSVLAWGLNDIGELGNGTVSEPRNPARSPSGPACRPAPGSGPCPPGATWPWP
jgi:hypothetical protein